MDTNKLKYKFDKKFKWEIVVERTNINLHKKEKPIKRKQVISKLMLVVPKIFQKFTVWKDLIFKKKNTN